MFIFKEGKPFLTKKKKKKCLLNVKGMIKLENDKDKPEAEANRISKGSRGATGAKGSSRAPCNRENPARRTLSVFEGSVALTSIDFLFPCINDPHLDMPARVCMRLAMSAGTRLQPFSPNKAFC